MTNINMLISHIFYKEMGYPIVNYLFFEVEPMLRERIKHDIQSACRDTISNVVRREVKMLDGEI